MKIVVSTTVPGLVSLASFLLCLCNGCPRKGGVDAVCWAGCDDTTTFTHDSHARFTTRLQRDNPRLRRTTTDNERSCQLGLERLEDPFI